MPSYASITFAFACVGFAVIASLAAEAVIADVNVSGAKEGARFSVPTVNAARVVSFAVSPKNVASVAGVTSIPIATKPSAITGIPS